VSGLLVHSTWWNAVGNTPRFAIVSVVLESGLGLIVALALNAQFVRRGFALQRMIVSGLTAGSVKA
jgi:trehalose/maltose transport system permease protein